MTEGEQDRKSRHQRHFISSEGSRVCPVCGITVRKQELEAHFEGEIEQLHKLTTVGSRSLRYPHHKKRKQEQEDEDDDSQTDSRYEEYLRLRRKRETRKRSKTLTTESDGAGCSGLATTKCPVCGIALTGTPQEMNQHAEACLNKQASGESILGDSDEADVNIEDDESFDEYTWCGQTRIRATSMLEGGLQGCGFKTVQSINDDNGDDELDVEGDESVEYGPPVYSESDVIYLPEGMEEHPESMGTGTLHEERHSNGYHDRGQSTYLENNNCDAINHQNAIINEATCLLSPSAVATVSPETQIKKLEEQLKELQKQVSNKHQTRCLICLDLYMKPVISIQCWHVYCEECWMRTLGAKKLCPQCQMITSPNQLRRIYL